MHLLPTALPSVNIIIPSRIEDERGFFSEVFNPQIASAVNADGPFVQDNHSHSRRRGTIRGLHYQAEPFAQVKLVRVVRGAIFDVVVDIRHGSPTFGRHVGVELTAENWMQTVVPIGFAHGFCTLSDHTDVIYKVSKPYSMSYDFGIRWNDPQLNITWPVTQDAAVISDKDRNLPLLAEAGEHFRYEV